jgi:K+-sensing histidine kinase KdpD
MSSRSPSGDGKIFLGYAAGVANLCHARGCPPAPEQGVDVVVGYVETTWPGETKPFRRPGGPTAVRWNTGVKLPELDVDAVSSAAGACAVR